MLHVVHDGSCNYDSQSLTPLYVAAQCSGPVWVAFPVSFSSLPPALLESRGFGLGSQTTSETALLLELGRTGVKTVRAFQTPDSVDGLHLGM